MLICAFHEITRDADIERAVAAACHDVDEPALPLKLQPGSGPLPPQGHRLVACYPDPIKMGGLLLPLLCDLRGDRRRVRRAASGRQLPVLIDLKIEKEPRLAASAGTGEDEAARTTPDRRTLTQSNSC